MEKKREKTRRIFRFKSKNIQDQPALQQIKKYQKTIDSYFNLCYNTNRTVNTDNTVNIVNRRKEAVMYQNFSGKRDVYLDVADRFIQYIKLGVIKNGEKLPSVREAAGDMGINPNTVSKAYSMLEEQGYVRSIPKKGAFVIFDATRDTSSLAERDVLHAMKQRGISKQAILELLEEVYAEND